MALLELHDKRHRLRTVVAVRGFVVLQPGGTAAELTDYLPPGPAVLRTPLLRGVEIIVGTDLLESDRAGLVEQRHTISGRDRGADRVLREDECPVTAGPRIPFVA
ncbi:hypothetical protein GCM10010172_73020 [Paractinoplanes ferrugineus]|uniref:Uncharacterized protein n=1 Tax=Paractinoplanes ferrugineus TaxID=113564 RepID=A0A919J0B2_9ACTN|nr:hypothetical protein [Actinoplanes ferrugineus]GIE11543.1 hypothetical protein Afe05nite_33830 [Actinoplanes ferrugineus]